MSSTNNSPDKPRKEPGKFHHFMHGIELSAVFTVVGIILFFSISVAVVLIAPRYVDPTWTTSTSPYQVQMYEISDPNFYISSTGSGSSTLQALYHLKNDYTLLAFHETDSVRIVAPKDLEKYVTKHGEKVLKLTSTLLMLRPPQKNPSFDAIAAAEVFRKTMVEEWEKEHPKWKEDNLVKPGFEVLELFQPAGHEAFAVASTEGMLENWVDAGDYHILDATQKQPYHGDAGVIYVNNPTEYKVTKLVINNNEEWHYDPKGEPLKSFEELTTHPLKFRSRAELIAYGEHIYAIEGCWYCHTDQTRTLVQDVVLNGSDSYPAPPSCANEYIYQKITFPGTRRIGPDISRVGIKRPSRDWHKGHFWSPKTASKGSIMPAFRHFFDYDPRGTSKVEAGVPNYKFEAIFQYLMTKGTRITPPTHAWWLGKDPVHTKEIIEGRWTLPP